MFSKPTSVCLDIHQHSPKYSFTLSLNSPFLTISSISSSTYRRPSVPSTLHPIEDSFSVLLLLWVSGKGRCASGSPPALASPCGRISGPSFPRKKSLYNRRLNGKHPVVAQLPVLIYIPCNIQPTKHHQTTSRNKKRTP